MMGSDDKGERKCKCWGYMGASGKLYTVPDILKGVQNSFMHK